MIRRLTDLVLAIAAAGTAAPDFSESWEDPAFVTEVRYYQEADR